MPGQQTQFLWVTQVWRAGTEWFWHGAGWHHPWGGEGKEVLMLVNALLSDPHAVQKDPWIVICLMLFKKVNWGGENPSTHVAPTIP